MYIKFSSGNLKERDLLINVVINGKLVAIEAYINIVKKCALNSNNCFKNQWFSLSDMMILMI